MNKDSCSGQTARQVWFDGRAVAPERTDIWELINNSAIDTVVITPDQQGEINFPLRTRLVVEIDSEEKLAAVTSAQIVMSSNELILDEAARRGYETCIFLSVDNREQLERAWQVASRCDYAVLEFDLPTNIPLELVIARLQNCKTVILKRENSLEGMQTAFGVLERGSDGVLLTSTDTQELSQINSHLLQKTLKSIELQALTVEEVRHIGMGVRGCIDTTGLMAQSEGMIVGSTSNGGILVCSETHFLPYMNLRPFRVNAGAVHSYVWMTEGKAEYITDLSAGSKVLCVNTEGQAREMVVGRVKMEVRPLLLIRGKVGDQELNVIVQDDWHIRVMGADKNPKNATLVRPGDKLLAYVDEPGRHVGLKVQETIVEK